MKNNHLVLLLTALLCLPASIFAETIVLKSGNTVEGKIIEKTDKYIKINFEGVPITYYLNEIESVTGTNQDLSSKKEIELFQGNNSISNKTAEGYLQSGIACYQKGDLPQAISDLTKAIEINPNFAQAYYNRGIAYYSSNKFDEAIRDYDKSQSINFDPERARALGSGLEPLRYKEVDFSYSSLLDEKAKNIVIKIRGTVTVNDIGIKDTLNLLEPLAGVLKNGVFRSVEIKLLSMEASVSEALWILRWDDNKLKKFHVTYSKSAIPGAGIEITEEIEDIDRARQQTSLADERRLQGNNSVPDSNKTAAEHYQDGIINYQKRNFSEATTDFNKSIKINPDVAQAYCSRGLSYGAQGRFREAISDYNKAIELMPNFPIAYNNRALTYLTMKEYDRAWEDVHKVEALGGFVHPGFLDALKKASGRDK